MRMVLVGYDKPIEALPKDATLLISHRKCSYHVKTLPCGCVHVFKLRFDPNTERPLTFFVWLCNWHTADLMSAARIHTNGPFTSIFVDVEKSKKAQRAIEELGITTGGVAKIAGLEEVVDWKTLKALVNYATQSKTKEGGIRR